MSAVKLNTTNISLISSLKIICIVMITGLGFGILMSIVSNAFVIGVEFLFNSREKLNFIEIDLFDKAIDIGPLLSLFLAVGVILLVRHLFSIDRWYGPADSIYAAHRTDNELDVKKGFGSTIAAFISAGSGASVGQYGPLVHFGATVGSYVRTLTKGNISADVFIGCGVAGAISAGFNAPIAGTIFACETILRHFSLRAVAPVAITSITAAGISKIFFGNINIFSISNNVSTELVYLLPFALLAGPLFGFLSITYMVFLRKFASIAKDTNWSPFRLLLIAACITGIIGIFLPEILGLGVEHIQNILNDGFSLNYLFLLLIGKLLITSVCIGFGMFGGIFSPALFIGATAGALLTKFATIIGGTTVGLAIGPGLIICGMAAISSTVVGTPIAGVLIILELTMSYELALAAMLSVVTSALIAHLLFGHSFFDRQLLDRGIDISQGRSHIELMEQTITHLPSKDFLSFSKETQIKDAIKKMTENKVSEAYIVSNQDTFIGKVSLHGLLTQKDTLLVTSSLIDNPIQIKHDASLQQSIEIASKFVGESIPVVNLETKEILGVLSEADLFQAYLATQNKIIDLEKK
ncbi:chloride channel protein [Alphaproteobacteria bacterium]|nr:chloride channel protein [Alphaproteobacteria bacterium]